MHGHRYVMRPDSEQRYSQTEKEALGVVWACERFHVCVYGMKFVVEIVQSFYGKKSVNLPLIATEGFSTVLDSAMYPY